MPASAPASTSNMTDDLKPKFDVGANGAELALRQIAAARAAMEAARRLLQRRHEFRQLVRLFHEEVESDALGGTITQAGKLL